MNPTATEATGVRGRVEGAIAQAAARSGVDFSYLYNQARLESSLNPEARARTSSATGLFQFIDQTWLATVEKHGARHGLGWAASAIQRGANGRYHVADPQVRQQVMNLRRNPEAASAMAAEFANDNRAHLERRLGRPAEPVDMYLAHFLGAGGATRFLQAHAASPNATAAGAFPAQARANRAIFYDRQGSPRSFAEIRNLFAARLNISGGNTMMASAARTAPPPTDGSAERLAALHVAPEQAPAGLSPRYARLAYLMLAELGA
jgi:soluble lytic murein transglycosylase-like protein